MNNSDQKESLQNGKKGTERVQTKLGKTHVDYWYSKLQKRHFTGRDGVEVTMPDWHVRIKHQGRVVWFNLKTANAAEAAGKARDIYVFLAANGLDATLEKFKPQTEKRDNQSLEEFAELYREKVKVVEYPPIKRTVESYLSCLFFICALVKVKRLGQLTVDKIKQFIQEYLKRGREKGRDATSVKTSCNSYLRGAGSLFSKQMIEAFEADGIELVNPFVGQRIRRIEIKPYTPLQPELLDMIWKDAVKLRDGDPDAPIPPRPPRQKRRKRRKGGGVLPPLKKRQRWTTPNWRKPHPASNTILLLELGLGLRREEADKAQWDWFFTSRTGRRFIEVRKTEYFTPKGKRRRIIPVEQVLWDAIHETRLDLTPFIVPGKTPKIYTPETEPKEIVYRCERDHRVLVAWLRMKGINDDKPCHLLRKEFGSYVATSFGLFAAQRLLGHSSPAVTDAFYAGLTEMPELRHAQVPQGTTQSVY